MGENSMGANNSWELAAIVSGLRTSREITNKVRHRGHVRELPSRTTLTRILDDLTAALFPTHYAPHDLDDESIDYYVGNTLNAALTALQEQVRRGQLFVAGEEAVTELGLEQRAARITGAFANDLPAIRALLVSDLLAAYQGDPAASSISEILLCYPGMSAIMRYRLAHALHRLGAPFIARLASAIAHSATGIDIHPAAEIGPGLFHRSRLRRGDRRDHGDRHQCPALPGGDARRAQLPGRRARRPHQGRAASPDHRG